MKIKNSILTLLLFFTLVPVLVFGIFSIYETNQSIDEMAEKNLKAVSQNQIMNIQKFCGDRREEMEMVANYSLTQDAIRYSLGESDDPVDQEYVNNVLKERKKYGTYVASVSILDKNFHVVGSSESYDISEISELKYVDERFHTGDFIIGDSYERETDDGLKKIVPAYIGVFWNDNLIGYIAEELDTAYFDQLRLNMDSLAEATFYILDGSLRRELQRRKRVSQDLRAARRTGRISRRRGTQSIMRRIRRGKCVTIIRECPILRTIQMWNTRTGVCASQRISVLRKRERTITVF